MNYTFMNAEHEVLVFETDRFGRTGIVEILDGFKDAPLHFARHADDMTQYRPERLPPQTHHRTDTGRRGRYLRGSGSKRWTVALLADDGAFAC
ncbi:MAG: hypothetical protein K6B74_10550 [Ruminococcus sp.]|nr:hypothetical protein [Ruminococcus sp.]